MDHFLQPKTPKIVINSPNSIWFALDLKTKKFLQNQYLHGCRGSVTHFHFLIFGFGGTERTQRLIWKQLNLHLICKWCDTLHYPIQWCAMSVRQFFYYCSKCENEKKKTTTEFRRGKHASRNLWWMSLFTRCLQSALCRFGDTFDIWLRRYIQFFNLPFYFI